jgi:hypothetical protein
MVLCFNSHAHAIYPRATVEEGYGGPVCIPFAFALKRGLTRYSIHLLPASPTANSPTLKPCLTFPELNVPHVCLPATPLKSHRPRHSPSYDSLPYQPPNHLISKLAEPVTNLPPISASAASHVHQYVSARRPQGVAQQCGEERRRAGRLGTCSECSLTQLTFALSGAQQDNSKQLKRGEGVGRSATLGLRGAGLCEAGEVRLGSWARWKVLGGAY